MDRLNELFVEPCERTFGITRREFFANYYWLFWRVIVVICYYAIGVAYYQHNEGWNQVDCLFFITVSYTTVGYGHFHPTTDHARIFTVFYVLIGLAFVLTSLNAIAQRAVVAGQEQIIHKYSTVFAADHAFGLVVYKFFFSVVGIFTAVFIGTLFFSINEDWTTAQAFYWTMMTMFTVGYGDLSLKHKSSRQFSIFFILFCVIVYATAITNFQEIYRGIQRKGGFSQWYASVSSMENSNDDGNNNNNNNDDSNHGAHLIGLSSLHGRASAAGASGASSSSPFSSSHSNSIEMQAIPAVDLNAFLIEAMLYLKVVNKDRDLKPLLSQFEELQRKSKGEAITREKLMDFLAQKNSSSSGSGNGSSGDNSLQAKKGGAAAGGTKNPLIVDFYTLPTADDDDKP